MRKRKMRSKIRKKNWETNCLMKRKRRSKIRKNNSATTMKQKRSHKNIIDLKSKTMAANRTREII
jgi:hypothetical protein